MRSPISVFVVIVDSHALNNAARVGAVYVDEFAAVAEVERYEAANIHNKAYYVERQLGSEII